MPNGIADYLGPVSAVVNATLDQSNSVGSVDQEKKVNFHVYRLYKGIHNDDIYLQENSTLGKQSINEMSSKAETGSSLGDDMLPSKQCMYHVGNGYFQNSDVVTLPGDQVVDLTNLDFSKTYHRDYSKARLAGTPRLMVVLYFRPDHGKDEDRDDIHCACVCYPARRRIEQQKGFVIVKEQDGRQWNSPRADVVKQGIDV